MNDCTQKVRFCCILTAVTIASDLLYEQARVASITTFEPFATRRHWLSALKLLSVSLDVIILLVRGAVIIEHFCGTLINRFIIAAVAALIEEDKDRLSTNRQIAMMTNTGAGYTLIA